MIHELPKILFIIALLLASFFWGLSTNVFKIPPYSFLKESAIGLIHIANSTPWFTHWYYQKSKQDHVLAFLNPDLAQSGLNKIVVVDKNNKLAVKIIDLNGELVHRWELDWFSLWPDAAHLESFEKPKSPPGTHIHGAQILGNGDLLFNFEHLGLMRVDACGNPVWRLPYRTHHSIEGDGRGNFWVPAQKYHFGFSENYPNLKAPRFVDPLIVKVSPQGEIISEFSLLDVLQENQLQGLLYQSTFFNFDKSVDEDFLHLNDVEMFPEYLEEGFFKRGDLLISLRDVNAILVIEEKTLRVKYSSIGKYLRQHDPDFIDGNRFSVFDNNDLGSPGKGKFSRIFIEDARNGEREIVFSGSEEQPFYSQIMGKHQWLDNGNLLISESMSGRAFEITPKGEVVWDYYNLVNKKQVGILEEAERLPEKFDLAFFEAAQLRCQK